MLEKLYYFFVLNKKMITPIRVIVTKGHCIINAKIRERQ